MANKLRDLPKRKQKSHNKNIDGEEIPTCGVWIPSKKEQNIRASMVNKSR